MWYVWNWGWNAWPWTTSFLSRPLGQGHMGQKKSWNPILVILLYLLYLDGQFESGQFESGFNMLKNTMLHHHSSNAALKCREIRASFNQWFLQSKILVGQKSENNKQPKQHKLGYSWDNQLLCFLVEVGSSSKTYQGVPCSRGGGHNVSWLQGSHKTNNISDWKRTAWKIGFWRDVFVPSRMIFTSICGTLCKQKSPLYTDLPPGTVMFGAAGSNQIVLLSILSAKLPDVEVDHTPVFC